MALDSFDPADLTVTVGPYSIKGFAETQLTISRANPQWNTQVGSDGNVVRVKTNDTQTDVTLTLQQSSPSNNELNTIAAADEGANSNGIVPIEIKYTGGSGDARTLLKSSTAFIEKKPDATWGNTPNDREWVIKCAQAEYNLGVTSTTSDEDRFTEPDEG